MTKKILFLLTFLLTTLGGGNLAWAQTTVGYTEEIEGTTVGARVLSNGDLDHLEISDPIKGSHIGDYHGTTKNVYDNGTTLASTDSWQKTQQSTDYDDEQYVGYTLTVDDGYCLNISNVAAKILVADDTYTWKVVIYDKDGTAQYTSSPDRTANQSTTEDLDEFISISNSNLKGLTGTVTVKLFLYQNGSSKYFCINYLQLKVNISRMPYSDTYPYTWYFNVPAEQWTESKNQLKNSSSWHNNGNEARLGATSAPANNGIDIIKGLAFSDVTAATSNSGDNFTKGTLCLDWTNRWLWMNGKVTIPSLKVGQKVIFTSENAVTYSSSAGNVDVLSGKVFNITSPGDVTFTVSGGVWSIAVVKNDLTDFSFDLGQTYYGKSTPSSGKIAGAFIGRTNTFKYKLGRDQILRTTMRVDPDAETLVGRSLAANVDIPEFTKSSSNGSVLGTSGTACRSAANNVTYWDIPVNGCGTTNLTYSFAGSDAYNAEDYVQMITIEKDDPVLAFASNFITKTQGNPDFTNNLTLNGLSLPVTDDNAGTVYATYKSKNPSVATVDENTGQVSIVAPGVAIIEATVAESNWNNKATKKYTLVVNPASGTIPTIGWNDIAAGSTQNVEYNQSISYYATASAGTVKYRIADTSIAELDNKVPYKVTGKGIGSTTVTAYVEPTSTHNYAEISYNVKVISAGELKSFKFIPNNGKVNNGKSITPKLAFPTIPASGVTSLKVTQIDVIDKVSSSVTQTFTGNTISNCDIISVDAFDDLRNNWELDGVNKVFKVNVTINGKKVGKARITVTFESDYYDTATATYDVEVTQPGTINFSWTEGNGSPQYYTYAGDFMMLPALTGNSNGNYNYSSGAKNSSSYTEGGVSYLALHAYEYERKWDGSKFNIKWNNKNIKIGEGFPDFAIVTDEILSPGTASVFFGRGEGSSHPDTLMVYCEKAGDVKLRAYDPQDHTKYCDATIHILPISNIEGSATTVTNGMTYPYTWDFTTDFDMSVEETDRYWTPIKDDNGNPTGDYTNGYGFFNLDWADTNKTPDTVDRFYKYFIAGASSSNTGYMHLFNGAMLQLKGSTSWANKMDRMRIYAYDSQNKKGRLGFIGGYHTMKLFLPEVGKRPSDFKIFVKASGTGSVCIMGTDEKAVSSTVKTLSSDAAIYSFDISDVTYTSNGYILMGFEDARVYWIAMSTEEKQVNPHPTSGMRAATYSYGEDLNITYSGEANPGLKAYVASSFSSNSVNLTEAPAKVKSGTGLVLKSTSNKGTYSSCYMIACGKNLESYSSPAPLAEDANYLKPSVEGETIQRFEGTEGQADRYTNFLLSKTYVAYDENTGQTTTESGPTTGWLFLRVNGESDAAPANMSYLHVPGTLRVINTNYSAARRAGEEDDKPASKNMLFINFIDEPDDLGTTDISAVSNDGVAIDNDAWYTLQGVRVSAPTKGGIYIHNGRKVVIK